MNRHNDQSSSAPTPEPGRASASTARAFGPRDWLFALALFVAVLIVYQPALHGGLIWDDESHVTRPELRSIEGLFRIWFDVKATYQYYPLLHSAFWIEHKLWGDAVLGYHLVNVLLHAASAVMVALILRRLKIPGAYLAAAIFALHPVNVESVAWITEQKNTLSAVFYLGAMLAYLHFDQTRKTPLYTAAFWLFVLGLLSKTVTATLPAALLVIFWWQRGRLSWRRDVRPLVWFFVLGAAAGLFTAWVERKLIGAEGAAFDLTLIERCLIAGRVIWFYLGKLFWPTELLFIYPHWHISQAVWWQYLYPLAALMLVAVLWGLRRRWRGPLAGLLYFVGTLFPVLGFCNVYPFIYSYVADHFQYLASLGIITLASAGAALLLDRCGLWRRPGGYILCLLLLAGLAGLTRQQSQKYADIETLYRATIDGNSECWMAHYNLGNMLAKRGELDEAIAHFGATVQIKPDFVDAYNNLGLALAERGRLDEAIIQLEKALEVKPDYEKPHVNLGIALTKRERLDEAIAHFRTALQINPDDAAARKNLDIALSQRGKILEKLAERRELLGSRQDDVALLDETAWLLATNPNASIRNGAEAVELAERAVQLSGGREPAVLGTLAAAYAEAGRFSEAVEMAQRALALVTSQDNATLAENLCARIKLYQSGAPCRELRQPSPSPSGDR